MVQSPSWEANWFAASQEIPRISRNPKVHYRTHKSPPPVSILDQPNPVHIPTTHLLEILPNITHPSTSFLIMVAKTKNIFIKYYTKPITEEALKYYAFKFITHLHPTCLAVVMFVSYTKKTTLNIRKINKVTCI